MSESRFTFHISRFTFHASRLPQLSTPNPSTINFSERPVLRSAFDGGASSFTFHASRLAAPKRSGGGLTFHVSRVSPFPIDPPLHHSTTPSLHHSITPSLH